MVGQQVRFRAEPAGIGRMGLGGDQRITPAVGAPADDLVGGVGVRPRALDRDPRVDTEGATPAHRARAVDLHHRLALAGRVGRQACAVAARLVPGCLQVEVSKGQNAKRAQQQQQRDKACDCGWPAQPVGTTNWGHAEVDRQRANWFRLLHQVQGHLTMLRDGTRMPRSRRTDL